jgi:deazaflavin-dependent oxidoreductase (nitroreductase family)
MPSDRFLKTGNVIHRAILKLSGGRIGWKVGKMPVVELTTIGRKSQHPRTVMLTSPCSEGDEIVIVASKGGEDTHPAWFLNLQANPEATVKLQGQPVQKMTARVATPDERAHIWPLVTSKYSGYAGYQKKTEREIPIVLLKPAG